MPHVTTADGTRLFYKDWGAGRPVLMAHGWPLSADTFDSLSQHLAEHGFRAVAYDRRGFGRSDQPWNGYDYDTLADDMAAVIDHLGLNQVTLLGFSMGGGEVARYLSRHGTAKVAQAALVASVVPCMKQRPDNPEGVEPAVFDDMARGLREDRAKFFTGFFKDFYGMGLLSHPVSDEVLADSWRQAMMAGLRPTLACASAFANTDFRADLPAFTVPTLVLHGTDDKTVPIETSARAAARAIPGARLVEIAGGPHGLLASHATQVQAELLRFVQRGE